MTEAFMERGHERQVLVDELMRIIYQAEDKYGKDFLFNLIIVMVRYLKKRRTAVQEGSETKKVFAERSLFYKEILPKIEDFSRAPEERDLLVVDFLRKVLDSVLGVFGAKLLELEIRDPKTIFRAPSAMSEVPLNEG